MQPGPSQVRAFFCLRSEHRHALNPHIQRWRASPAWTLEGFTRWGDTHSHLPGFPVMNGV